MNCEEAREGLWPPERPRLLEDEVAEARAHVSGCAECQHYFLQDRYLLETYDRARREPAPLAVRERVFDALAQARFAAADESKRTSSAGRWAVVAAAVVAAAAGGSWLATAGPESRAQPAGPGIFAEDYLRRAVGQDQIVTSDALEVRRFLQRELGMGLEPLRLTGLTLERAEVCLIAGRRGAMVIYEMDGATISHYLIPDEGARRRSPTVAEHRSAPGGGSMPIVLWSTPQVEQALIGDVDADALLRIARAGMT